MDCPPAALRRGGRVALPDDCRAPVEADTLIDEIRRALKPIDLATADSALLQEAGRISSARQRDGD